MKKFGVAASNEAKSEAMLCVRSEENVPIELAKKSAVQLATKDDVEDKFYEESLAITEGLFKEKKVWTASRPSADAEPVGISAPADDNVPGKYVPPSLRGAQGKGDGKGGKDGAY